MYFHPLNCYLKLILIRMAEKTRRSTFKTQGFDSLKFSQVVCNILVIFEHLLCISWDLDSLICETREIVDETRGPSFVGLTF